MKPRIQTTLSLISDCPHKTEHALEILLQFSLLSPFTMLKLGKNVDTHAQSCLWDGGRDWACEY